MKPAAASTGAMTIDSDLLKGADIVVLLLVLVQFTHDEALLDEAAPYIKGPWDYSESLPGELKARIRSRLATILADHAAGRVPSPPPPPHDLMMKMMRTSVGEAVPEEYLPMLLEEMGLASADARSLVWRKPVPKSAIDTFHVVVIGAGLSGICAGIKLRQAGIPFTILEKNDQAGGTWYENSYPGCSVDTPNHFYSFSFEPNHEWTHYFSKRDELFAYLNRCTDKYGIRDNIRFRHEVVSATYDDALARWSVTTRNADGKNETLEANAVIFAVGQLNRPFIPDIQGLADFKGPIVHTAQWDPDLPLQGRRVALIGSGASGVQVGPTIAPQVGHLTIFQRSPHWVSPSPNYHRSVGDAKKWALNNIPFYANWYRFQLLWGSADGIYPTLRVDPAWDKPDQSLNAANEKRRQELIGHVKSVIGDDPELLEKVIPPFPPYGKRMLRDNHWYATLKRDNVDLVTSPIARVTPDAVVTADGERHEADVIILATGFRAAKMLAPVDVVGRGGVTLRDVWGDEDPRAYIGITVPKFPNMFILFGPNTVLAHGGSAIFHTECQVRYTLHCLREMIEGGYSRMECRQDVHDEFNERVDRIHEQMVWSHKGMRSWYKNSKGRVVMTTPWRMVDYWKFTSALNPDDYRFSK